MQHGGGGTPVEHIKEIGISNIDKIIITPIKHDEMVEQLHGMGVPADKIIILVDSEFAYENKILGHSYYGQHCDDLIIAAIFARIGIEKPSYIDLGANHPVYINNTYFLYRQGCRGINIDANPNMIELFKRLRPEDTNVCTGVALQEGTMPFFMFDEQSGLNTFSQEEAKRWNLSVKKTIDLPVTTLSGIVEKYCPDGFPDFLDCDIEGLDYDVLRDYDIKSNGPKVILVEVRRNEIEKFDELLDAKNYFRFCRIGENNIYVRNEYSNVVSHM